MRDLVQKFPDQLQDAISKFENLEIEKPEKAIQNIVCAGMWWSGIAWTFVEKFGNKGLKIPYTTCKDYDLPNFVNENTLVIVSSHSWNTEETISTMLQAKDKKANIVCISSGWKIFEFARENNLNLISLPDWMMPRACYTYSLVAQFFLLEKLWLLNINIKNEINNIINLIRENESDFKNIAINLAKSIDNKTPLIFADSTMEPVAIRFRQQLNENSKILWFTSTIPESNHNELLWRKDFYENILPIFLRHNYEHKRNNLRIELTKQIIGSKVEKISEIKVGWNTLLEQLFSMIYITDWASVYLAEIRQVDPIEIETINFLKNELSKNS